MFSSSRTPTLGFLVAVSWPCPEPSFPFGVFLRLARSYSFLVIVFLTPLQSFLPQVSSSILLLPSQTPLISSVGFLLASLPFSSAFLPSPSSSLPSSPPFPSWLLSFALSSHDSPHFLSLSWAPFSLLGPLASPFLSPSLVCGSLPSPSAFAGC